MNSRYGNRVFILIFFVIGVLSTFQVQAAIQEYWIAAEKISWNYAPSTRNQIDPDAGLGVWGESLKYIKYRYIGYTDSSFSVSLPQAEWMGILGSANTRCSGGIP